MTAGRRLARTAAMRCSGPACWVLLLVVGLCFVHRARPRNVLLILGKFRPAGTPGTALHGRRLSTPEEASANPPCPEDPIAVHSPTLLFAGPRLFVVGSLERQAEAALSTAGSGGVGPSIHTPFLPPVLTL